MSKNSKKKIIKPKHLRKGDMVGLIAPASPVFNNSELLFIAEWLAKLGLRYKLGNNIHKQFSDLAGTDEERLADFHEMWNDKSVSAILPIRGGNGCSQLLAKIDFELIKSNPKIFIGYSDLTSLINAIHERTGLITFHGPMASSFFRSSYTYHYFSRTLLTNKPIGLVVDPISSQIWSPKYPPYRVVISEGKAQGQLAGGCMTLIKQLMGTEFEIESEGKILFLEDVNEEPHAIDRYLTQLLLAGTLQKAKGIIVGECFECAPGDSSRHRLDLNKSIEAVLRERLGNLGIPVLYGLRLGHGQDQLTLPIGVKASLEVSKQKIKFKIEEEGTS